LAWRRWTRCDLLLKGRAKWRRVPPDRVCRSWFQHCQRSGKEQQAVFPWFRWKQIALSQRSSSSMNSNIHKLLFLKSWKSVWLKFTVLRSVLSIYSDSSGDYPSYSASWLLKLTNKLRQEIIGYSTYLSLISLASLKLGPPV